MVFPYQSMDYVEAGGTGIDQASELNSIFTAQDVEGTKELKETELFFDKSGDTSLLYIFDNVNNNIPLQFTATQDNADNNNNSVSISVDNVSSSALTLLGSKVGVNKPVPTYQLEVGGDIRGDDIHGDQLALQNDYTESGTEYVQTDVVQLESQMGGAGNTGGELVIKTKVPNSTITEKLRINGNGAIGLGGANYGTANQVLISNGSGSAVTWADQATVSPSFNNITVNGDILTDGTNINIISATHAKKLEIANYASNEQSMEFETERFIIVPKVFPYLSTAFEHYQGEIFGLRSGVGRSLIQTSAGSWSDDRSKYNEISLAPSECLRLCQLIPVKKYTKIETLLTDEEEAALEAGGTYQNLGDGVSAQPMEEVGVIAQELANIDELNFAVTPGDENTHWSVKYNNFICINSGAIQELYKLIQKLETENATIKNALNELLSDAGKQRI